MYYSLRVTDVTDYIERIVLVAKGEEWMAKRPCIQEAVEVKRVQDLNSKVNTLLLVATETPLANLRVFFG